MNRSSNKHAIYCIISYSILLIYIFVLWHLPNDWFRDRDVYLIYAKNYDTFLKSEDPLKQLVNEPLFSQIAGLFSNYPEFFPICMSIFIASIYFILVIKKSKNIVIFFLATSLLFFNTFLIFPQLFQQRQGLATAFFLMIFFFIKRQRNRIILSCILPFIHVVFFIITPIYIIYELYLQHKEKTKIILSTSLTTIIFSLLSISLMYMIGFRQADLYNTLNEGRGGGSFLLHLFLLIYIYFWGNRYDQRLYGWVLLGLTFYIFSYFIFPASGRLFSSFYPFILIYLVSRDKLQDLAILFLMNIVFIYLFFSAGYLDMLNMNAISFDYELERFIRDLF
ncbi:EpsG family protein [Acinetobacter sp. ANC 3882]|uniref:EpsG family protein n=1 Tax=Acinetobacter sp. ANC 3882 TaxID=2923423 RepID=UPI001F4B9559|nr:EpsG family protein [Acinetobacter sp. ANC 3882]MCH7315765.1 EpsG family protein [Acinetobacter sp. ANC 3882]